MSTGQPAARALAWTHGTPHGASQRVSTRLAEFDAVYDDCLPVVLRYMLARVKDPVVAEDLAADVFERAVRAWPRFEGRSSTRTWVLGIAHNVVSHHWRGAARRSVRLDNNTAATLPAVGPMPHVEIERMDDAAQLQATIALLSQSDQELLALRFAADLSLKEMAAVLGAREVTLRVRMHRALKRLRALLEAAEGGSQ